MVTTKKTIWKTAAAVILAIAVAFTFMPMMGGGANAASKATKAKKAYKKMLSQKKIKSMESESGVTASKCKFQIVDLDKNKVPELVVVTPRTKDMPGMINVFTYRNGGVKEMGSIGYAYQLKYYKYYPKAKAIKWRISDGRGYYKIKKGKFNSYLTCGRDYEKKGWPYSLHYLDKNGKSKKISKSKYKKLVKKLGKGKKFKFKKNTKKNRAII